MNDQAVLKKHLIKLLDGGHAYMKWEEILSDIPQDQIGVVPDELPYSIWQQVEHLRIALWDILEFSRDPKHVSPEWPKGYWPESNAPGSREEWDASLKKIDQMMQEMKELIADPESDLLLPFAHGKGQTLLREALLVAEHNAYHFGQVVIMKRLLSII